LNLFGWKHKKTGYRRYKKAYISMARKNGKSVLVGGIALYLLLFGKHPSLDRQIFATANSKDQAKLVYKMITSQLNKLREKSKTIKKRTKMLQNEIQNTYDGSLVKPLSKDVSNKDGLNTLLAIFDEYHESKTEEMLEVMESSQTLQKEGLILIISTAGFELNAPMHRIEYKYIGDLLEQKFNDENYFALCYEQDDTKEISNEKNWIKSNPLLENESLEELISDNIRKRLKESREKNNLHGILVKNFNVWQSSSERSFIHIQDWVKNQLSDEEFISIKKREVYFGVDLSRTTDLSSVGWIIPIEEKKAFLIGNHSFVGTKGGLDMKIQKDKIDYRKLEEKGLCSITKSDSGVIDYKEIIKFINDFVEENDLIVKGVMYDPYSSPPFITELENKYTLIEVRQGFQTLSPATKDFEVKVLEGKIIFYKNELLEIAINNSIVINTNDAIKINKDKNRNKIDPVISLINGWTQSLHHDFEKPEINDFILSDEFSF
jgi:phage terminase large subunit-like protein